MLSRFALAACLVACTARQPARSPAPTPPAAPSEPGAPAAPAAPVATVAPAPYPAATWIRFMPQSTYFCVRLPDGQVRSTAYGVGGNHYSLQEGIELAHAERDALCTNYGITVLGARGVIANTAPHQSNYGYYTPELVEPRARSLGRIGVSRCFLDDAGAVSCINVNGTGAAELATLMNALGPIDHLLADGQCAVYRDGQVACASENAQPRMIPMFTNARTASIVSHGWSHFAGCALLRTGKVACVGANSLMLRGFADPDRAPAVEIPGLDNIDEVTAYGWTACARKGGNIWCWGEAAASQAGAAARKNSKPMPVCQVDTAATKAAQDAFDAAQNQCRGPRPAGDDPLCRSMWQAQRPGTQFKPSATPCDRSLGQNPSRWAPPTQVDGIDDALAIGTNGRLTCALRPANVITCWGNNIDAPKSLTFPARTIAAEADTPPGANIASPRGLSVQVGRFDALVTSTSGVRTRHALSTSTVGAGTVMAPVTDALVEPACTLDGSGVVTCLPTPGWEPKEFPAVPGAVRLSMNMADGCVIDRAGMLRCGTPKTREHGSAQVTASLAAIGPIVEHNGMFARYADGTVRMFARDQRNAIQIAVKWQSPRAVSLDGYVACVATQQGDVECIDYYATHAKLGISKATHVAANSTYGCAVREDTTVWCWEQRTKKPAPITGVTGALAVGVGVTDKGLPQACALTKDAEVACWGGGSSTVRRAQTKID